MKKQNVLSSTSPSSSSSSSSISSPSSSASSPNQNPEQVDASVLLFLITELKKNLVTMNAKIGSLQSDLVDLQEQEQQLRSTLDALHYEKAEQDARMLDLQTQESALRRYLGGIPEPYDDERETKEVLIRIDLLSKEQHIFEHQSNQLLTLMGQVFETKLQTKHHLPIS